MKTVVRLLILSIAMVPMATSAWSPVDGAMLTQWGENVTPDNVWTEYPRPQLVRNNWINLNGLWNLTSVGGVSIVGNAGLTSLSGLDNLTSVGGVSISGNDLLTIRAEVC